MDAMLFAIGALLLVAGTLDVLYTERVRAWIRGLARSLSPKALALPPMVIGGLLMIGSPWSRSFWSALVLGALIAAAGVLLFFLPRESVNRSLGSPQQSGSDVTWRLVGLLLVISSVFLFLRL